MDGPPSPRPRGPASGVGTVAVRIPPSGRRVFHRPHQKNAARVRAGEPAPLWRVGYAYLSSVDGYRPPRRSVPSRLTPATAGTSGVLPTVHMSTRSRPAKVPTFMS